MFILGISAFYHDSAACLISSGKIIAAAQEERFTRKKHDAGFPENAIRFCLDKAGIAPFEIANVVFYEKPFVKFERLLETYFALAPRGFASFLKSMPIWLKDKLFQKAEIVRKLESTLGEAVDWRSRLLFSEHHLSHAASAFYPSHFKRAAVLTLDGVGEWTTASVAIGNGRELRIIKEIHFPHSLGLLYSAFTYYTGFKVNSGEYKVMGLAPYGTPRYADLIKQNLISICEDGSFQMNMDYFGYPTGLKMTNEKFNHLFGGPPRSPESNLTQREMDLAASVQKVTEEIVVKIAAGIKNETGEKNLCIAGGVGLNCVSNGLLLKERIFDDIWIQPAAGDAGGALGAALGAWHLHHQQEREISGASDSMRGAYLGPSVEDFDIEGELSECGAKFVRVSEDDLIDQVANALSSGEAVGWMEGGMEFGPRALGARSILADPRSANMQKQLNLKVKYRESFRPFAPSVLSECVGDWFDINVDSPYMLLVAKVREEKQIQMSEMECSLFGIDKLNVARSTIPAVTHVDYSARIQTVHSKTNRLFHRLLSRFNELTGCPMLVNTSFNVRGEPIVCTPTDAFKCFMGTELDLLVIGDFLMVKNQQNPILKEVYINRYELD